MSDAMKDLRKKKLPQAKARTEPLWQGPSDEGDNGGITYSMLSRFMVCRERFRIRYVEGIAPTPTFNHKLEFGNMWHICEEVHARDGDRYGGMEMKQYANNLCKTYPMSQKDVRHWEQTVLRQFPLYLDYWKNHPDMVHRQPLLQEQVFDVPYKLPSGRVVRLRGKWDSVDLVGGRPTCTCGADRTGPSAEAHRKGCPADGPRTVVTEGIWLQENKTKGQIDPGQIQRQLRFDLQTMMYLTALQTWGDNAKLSYVDGNKSILFAEQRIKTPLKGVRYNVVRRPFAGGKGKIVRRKGSKNKPEESLVDFYNRAAQYIKDEPGSYFMRWNVEVTTNDINKFRVECLDPILEQLCDWWEWVSFAKREGKNLWDNDVSSNVRPDLELEEGIHTSAIHWRYPYGIFNVLLEGGQDNLDEYLDEGSAVGLHPVEDPFPELR